MGFDAKMEGYDLVEVDGRVCLFSYMRLDRNSVPEGIFCYEVEDAERVNRMAEDFEIKIAGQPTDSKLLKPWNGRSKDT